MPSVVPPGSLWRVLKYASPSLREMYQRMGTPVPDEFWSTVRAKTHPIPVWSTFECKGNDGNQIQVSDVEFFVDELILAGETVSNVTNNVNHQFVKIIMPRVAYINRVHFNEDSFYLERVA